MKKIIFLCAPFVFFLLTLSCGNDNTTSSSVTSRVTRSFPTGMALSSAFVTDTNAGADRSLEVKNNLRTTITSGQTLEEKTAVLNTIIAAASDAACQITLPSISGAETSPSCYGPMLDFINHVDATAGNSDADATPPGNNSSDDGRLPTGDLGLYTSTDTVSSHACVAAKINSLVGFVADKVDTGLLLAASMNCVMTRAGTALPAVDATVDLTTSMNTTIQVNNAAYTVSNATLSRVADISGNPVYYYVITFNDVSDNTKYVSINLKHMSSASDNSTYKGKMWTKVVKMGISMGDSYAYSLLYEKTATQLNYKMLGGNYTSSAGNVSQLFASNGDLTINNATSTVFMGNVTQLISNTTISSGEGDYSFAWQAGVNDSATRVFNAYTSLNASNLLDGCGFFGYGAPIVFNTSTVPSNSITQFFCNWAGPGNSHTAVSGKGQKQCMNQNTSGIFVVDAAHEAISYAPNNSCDYNGTTQNPGGGNYNWSVYSGNNPNDYSTFAASFPGATAHSALTNNLITFSSDTDFANYTAPSAPTDVF